MTEHRIGTQEEWQTEHAELLVEEKELTRRGDELDKETPGASLVPGREGLHLPDGGRFERVSSTCSTGTPS